MKTEAEKTELLHLFTAVANSEATSEQMARFTTAVREDAGTRRLWYQYCGLELGLASWAAESAGQSVDILPFPVASIRPRFRVWRYAAAAAALILVGLGFSRLIPRANASSADYVATIAIADACEWDNHTVIRLGQRLAAGPLKLLKGRAVVHFDGGARMVIIAPAEVELTTPGSAHVVSGKVAVRAPEEAIGFKISTAEGSVIDLGTEFVVNVNSRHETECQVLSGKVEWHSARAAQKVTLLSEGETRRYRHGETDSLPATKGAFRDYVPAVQSSEAKTLLAYEPFDYPSGNVNAESLAGGFGWQSPWRGGIPPRNVDDPNARMTIEGGQSLRGADGLVAPAGGRLVFDQSREWRFRELPQPIDFGHDGVYYLSFLAQSPKEAKQHDPQSGRLILNFRSSTDFWSHYVGFAITSANQPVAIIDGNNRSSGQELPYGKTLLVVCKIITSRAGHDQLFMKVYGENEIIEAAETPEWTVVSRQVDLDSSFDYLILGVADGRGWMVDELRFGTEWNAVAPLTPAALRAQTFGTL